MHCTKSIYHICPYFTIKTLSHILSALFADTFAFQQNRAETPQDWGAHENPIIIRFLCPIKNNIRFDQMALSCYDDIKEMKRIIKYERSTHFTDHE